MTRGMWLALGVGSVAVVVGTMTALVAERQVYSYELIPAQRPAEAYERVTPVDLHRRRPRGLYLVVDTYRNRLFVKKDDTTLLEAPCSTGSGLRLRDVEGGREWIFDTPRGVFTIRSKAAHPVWTKPDWAFVETGEPIPSDWRERRDAETLGDYALYFGDGYAIHGTLYERYLGRSITHGCIRLGDEDLGNVYRLAPVGTRLYIF